MTAQLIEKVDLRGAGELMKIERLLEEHLEARWRQDAAGELSEEDLAELQAVSSDFIAQLRQFVVIADEAASEQQASALGTQRTARTQLTPAVASLALHSPLLMPLSPPPADAEMRQLEAEVAVAAQRVAELRASMQARLQEELAAKLAACRPTADLEAAAGAEQQHEQQAAAAAEDDCGSGAGGAAEAAAEQQQASAQAGTPQREEQSAGQQQEEQQGQAVPMDSEGAEQPAEEAAAPLPALPLSPRTEELRQRLLAAANRMPALRARLEQATDRLQRVVSAVAADISRPPPGTVEKAVLGKTPGRPAAAAGLAAPGLGADGDEENAPRVSPLFKQALESGQISTRRRTRDVQPVPYSQPE